MGKNRFSLAYDPTSILQAAIAQIEVFANQEAARLKVEPDGTLVALANNPLEKIINLARCFVGPIFSEEMRLEQEKKLSEIKQELLHARDVIHSHALLIEKLKQGNSAQRKLAERALEAIQDYNKVVSSRLAEKDAWATKYHFYNFERNQLLMDEEIRGKEISLPHTISIKYDSHPEGHPAQKSLKNLADSLLEGSTRKDFSTISSVPKKSAQVMVDAFRLRANRSIQQHLSHLYSSDILRLIHHTPLEIEEESAYDQIIMRQSLEIAPGFIVTLTGTFQKNAPGSNLSFPILKNELHLNLQATQTGFPYPGQHTGWALADPLADAAPLRSEQVPLFQNLEQTKKKVAQGLLFNPNLMRKSKQLFKWNREIFDQNKEQFLEQHRHLQEAILCAVGLPIDVLPFDAFYQSVAVAPSPFDFLTQLQQKLNTLYLMSPFKKLQEEWLVASSLLRIGSYTEKLQIATQILKEEQSKALAVLDQKEITEQWIAQMGHIIGKAGQQIILQYMSEKIGFVPPMLEPFEQKLQACTFAQLIAFLDDLKTDEILEVQNKSQLETKFQVDLLIFKSENIEELSLPATLLVQELEVYFNSRFYASNYRKNTHFNELEEDKTAFLSDG